MRANISLLIVFTSIAHFLGPSPMKLDEKAIATYLIYPLSEYFAINTLVSEGADNHS